MTTADTPEPLDFSVLQSRINQVKQSTASITEKQFKEECMTKSWVTFTLLPILNTPEIYQMLQNPKFVAELQALIVHFIKFASGQKNGL